ncbi:S8 family serine peptidase [Bosea sp. LjRoot9]|uniref:cyanobactin maturation protease PatG family protein n=1 Tax=Bosea sp. LjRoot9 TaxID=3342341 RepID=UPI003ECDE603
MKAPRSAVDWYQRLPGLEALHALGEGDPRVRIAVLDGPARGYGVIQTEGSDAALRHGTAIASIIGGPRDRAPAGLAPACTVDLINIYPVLAEHSSSPTCSYTDLARYIRQAIGSGANIINISASRQIEGTAFSAELSDAVAEAERSNVLIVAASGNDGCSCDTLPAALPNVLAVGAHDHAGKPLPMSNWGMSMRTQGILAPGLDVPSACLEGGVCRFDGTSFAAAIVSSIAALLMSVDVTRGIAPSGARIRHILTASADPCIPENTGQCGPFLLGRLNIARALRMLTETTTPNQQGSNMDTINELAGSGLASMRALAPAGEQRATHHPMPGPGDGITPACGCGGKCDGKCGGGAGCTCGEKPKPQLAYAIGRLGVSFSTLARRDSIWRSVNGGMEGDLKPISNAALLDLFGKQPFQTQSVLWTLSRTEVPMYAIVPTGAFAAETYKWFVEEWADAEVEFASIPGVIAGQTTLYDGNVVDVLVPDLRGMHSWSVGAYTKAIVDERKKVEPKASEAILKQDVSRFLGKILFSIRNKGVTPQDRALNAAATNAFNFSEVLKDAGRESMTLRDISVERSPINRAGSEYYDVLLTFFDPRRRTEVAPLLARFTIDVSDTVPVLIGEPTVWYEY